MGPNNQYPSAPQPQGNPYEFILNPSQPSSHRRRDKNRLVLTASLIIGGAVIFMIIVSLLLSALGPKVLDKTQVLGLAQTQTEIQRISVQATSSATQQATLNLATTIDYTMETQTKQTLALLAKKGMKPGKKELSLKQNATTDQKFTTAKSTSTFDQAYTQAVQDALTSYANTLKQYSGQTQSHTESDLMSNYYEQVQLLIAQIPFTQNTINSAGTTQASQ